MPVLQCCRTIDVGLSAVKSVLRFFFYPNGRVVRDSSTAFKTSICISNKLHQSKLLQLNSSLLLNQSFFFKRVLIDSLANVLSLKKNIFQSRSTVECIICSVYIFMAANPAHASTIRLYSLANLIRIISSVNCSPNIYI